MSTPIRTCTSGTTRIASPLLLMARSAIYGTLRDLGRNALIGPGYVETDLGVMKETRITERINLQFRAELFNLFNHPNFNYPVTSVFSAGSFNPTNPAASYTSTAFSTS
jgi:hypothetical protein